MQQTTNRRIRALLLLPTYPRKSAVSKIHQALCDAGHEISLRQLQRDLNDLSAEFPIESDGSNPAGWGWSKGAQNPFLSFGLDWQTALVFRYSELYLRHVLPKSSLDQMKPYFESACATLEKNSKAQRWMKNIRVVDKGIPLSPPNVHSQIEYSVSEALLRGKKVQVEYETRDERTKTHLFDVFAIVVRAGLIYVIGSYGKGSEIRSFLMHRIKKAEISEENSFVPSSFNVDTFLAEGGLGFQLGRETLEVKLAFSGDSGKHLMESKIAKDQIITKDKSNRLVLQATLADTKELRWWILGFGPNVEVVEPVKLRREISELCRESARVYQKD